MINNTMQSTSSTSAGQQMMNDVKQISSLTPQKSRHNIWPICAQVVKKNPKQFSFNGTPYFKVQLRDQSGNIEALAYNQNVDRYYNQLEEKQNYYFENATLKAVNRKYQNVGNEFEIILNDLTTIRACDESTTIGTAPIQLTSFEDASELEPSADNPINLLGLLLETGRLETKVALNRLTQNDKQVYMRMITLMDETEATLEVTLWSNEAKTFRRPSNTDHPVLLIQGVRVQTKFMGEPVLSTVSSSVFEFNPNIPEMKQLGPLVRKFGKNNEVEGVRRNLFSNRQESGESAGDETNCGDENGANAMFDVAAIKVDDTLIKTENDQNTLTQSSTETEDATSDAPDAVKGTTTTTDEEDNWTSSSSWNDSMDYHDIDEDIRENTESENGNQTQSSTMTEDDMMDLPEIDGDMTENSETDIDNQTKTHSKQKHDSNDGHDQIENISNGVNAEMEEENLTDYLQVENYIPDCENVIEATGDETEMEEGKMNGSLQGDTQDYKKTVEDARDTTKTDEDNTDESPSHKEKYTSDSDDVTIESDDDEDLIIHKHARKGTKRCIESDDEASSDEDTIIIDCPNTIQSATTHEQSCDVADLNDFNDVQTPRKKKKYLRIQAPVESSLETEYSYNDDEDDDDDDSDDDDDNDDDDDDTNSQSSNSYDGSESDIDSDSSAAEPVVDELEEFRKDPLCHHVRCYIYYMVMKAVGEEDDVRSQLDIMKSVQFVEDKIQAMKNIGESFAWNHKFKEWLECIPNYEGSPDSAEGLGDLTDCQVCNRKGHPWAYRVTLKGYPYDENTFEEKDVADEAEYMVGQYCYERSKLYHKLYHWPYHLFKKYERKLQEMENNPDDVLRDKQTIIRYYQELKQILHKVEQDYMDEGRRCNRRWERDNENY